MIQCTCKQFWEVFPNEGREEGEAFYSLYTTKAMDIIEYPGEHRRSVEEGERYYEDDLCPICREPLERITDELPLDFD